jgi:hypothetical protein
LAISDFFATVSSLEWEAEVTQECVALVVGVGGRHERHVHAADPIYAVRVDLPEHALLVQTKV